MAIASLIVSLLVASAVFYRNVIHDWRFRPKFKIIFSLEEPISRETVVRCPTEALEPSRFKMAFWPRLRVRNTGRSTARRCEGILDEVRNPKGELDKRYDPLALRWAIAPHSKGFEPLDIARDREVDLNIFTTLEGESNAPFVTHSDPRGVPLLLKPGDYWLRIVIYGDNFNRVPRGYAVQWDGKDYRGVKMQEMNEKPNGESCWPWPILKKSGSVI